MSKRAVVMSGGDARSAFELGAFRFQPPEHHQVVLHPAAPDREFMDSLEAARRPLSQCELRALPAAPAAAVV